MHFGFNLFKAVFAVPIFFFTRKGERNHQWKMLLYNWNYCMKYLKMNI